MTILHLQIDDAFAARLKAVAGDQPVEGLVRRWLEEGLEAEAAFAHLDPADDEAIGEATLQRGDGIPLDVFQRRLETFGRHTE